MKLKLNYVYDFFLKDYGKKFPYCTLIVLKVERDRYHLRQIDEPYSLLTWTIMKNKVKEKDFKVNTIETLKWKYGKSNSKKR
jgi:hypothetical protein